MIQMTFHPASRRPAGLLRRLGPLAALGLVAAFGASHAAAQEEQEEALNRREVSRALDIAEEHIDDAEKAVRDGDMEAANAAWSQAGGLFLRVLRDYPDRHDVRLEIARIYRISRNGKRRGRLRAGGRGARGRRRDLEAWTELTTAYANLENDVKVIEAGQKVIELNPSPPALIYLGLGGAMARQGTVRGGRGHGAEGSRNGAGQRDRPTPPSVRPPPPRRTGTPPRRPSGALSKSIPTLPAPTPDSPTSTLRARSSRRRWMRPRRRSR